jgi:hypothetical protein
VRWWAFGYLGEIRRLLGDIPAIGVGWSRGLGRVASWTVSEGYEGEIRRWVPADYAKVCGFDGKQMICGIRPPARLPENRALCVLPDHRATSLSNPDEFFRAVDILEETRS